MDLSSGGGLCPEPYEEAESGPCVECDAKNIQIANLEQRLTLTTDARDRYYQLFTDAVKLAGERWGKLYAAEVTISRIRETCKERFRMLRATIDSLNKAREDMVDRDFHNRVVETLRRARGDEPAAVAYWKEQYEAEAAQCRDADHLVDWICCLCDPGARAEDPAARNAYASWELYRAKYPKEPT